MRTFKEHTIYETTIEEKLSNNLAVEPHFRSYRVVLNEYVKSLNQTKSLEWPLRSRIKKY
jgi:hypothetical protein